MCFLNWTPSVGTCNKWGLLRGHEAICVKASQKARRVVGTLKNVLSSCGGSVGYERPALSSMQIGLYVWVVPRPCSCPTAPPPQLTRGCIRNHLSPCRVEVCSAQRVWSSEEAGRSLPECGHENLPRPGGCTEKSLWHGPVSRTAIRGTGWPSERGPQGTSGRQAGIGS